MWTKIVNERERAKHRKIWVLCCSRLWRTTFGVPTHRNRVYCIVFQHLRVNQVSPSNRNRYPREDGTLVHNKRMQVLCIWYYRIAVVL